MGGGSRHATASKPEDDGKRSIGKKKAATEQRLDPGDRSICLDMIFTEGGRDEVPFRVRGGRNDGDLGRVSDGPRGLWPDRDNERG